MIADELKLEDGCFFFAMITADKTAIIEATNVIPSNWAGNSGTVGDGEGEVLVNTMDTSCVPKPMDSP